MHPEYAKEMNVGSPKPEHDKVKAYDALSTVVDIFIQPEHTGHDPNEDRDVNLLSVDDRVTAKIQDLAKSQNLDNAYIKTEVYKFSEKLVADLGIGKDSTQFFPNFAAIKRVVKRFRAQLRRDPHDHLAVQKLIEHDRANNPGRCYCIALSLLLQHSSSTSSARSGSNSLSTHLPQSRAPKHLQRADEEAGGSSIQWGLGPYHYQDRGRASGGRAYHGCLPLQHTNPPCSSKCHQQAHEE